MIIFVFVTYANILIHIQQATCFHCSSAIPCIKSLLHWPSFAFRENVSPRLFLICSSRRPTVCLRLSRMKPRSWRRVSQTCRNRFKPWRSASGTCWKSAASSKTARWSWRSSSWGCRVNWRRRGEFVTLGQKLLLTYRVSHGLKGNTHTCWRLTIKREKHCYATVQVIKLIFKYSFRATAVNITEAGKRNYTTWSWKLGTALDVISFWTRPWEIFDHGRKHLSKSREWSKRL